MILTPLRLVLIILVVGSLCFLFKDMVEADSSRSSISSRCQSIIDKIKNTCSNKSYKDCKKCIRAKSHTACHDQDDNVVNPIIQGLCQKQHPKTPSSPPSGPSPKTPPSGPKTCQTWFNKNNKCPKGLKKPDKTQCKNGNCNKQTCCKRKQSPSPKPPKPPPPPSPPPPSPPQPSPPSPPPTSIKTFGDWLNDNKTKCNPGNSINFEKIPCGVLCNKYFCCGGDPDKESDYCMDFVTKKDSNQFRYCMNKYPSAMCMNNKSVTPDQCHDLDYCNNQYASYDYCKGKYIEYYCYSNRNATKEQCNDNMADYCKNSVSTYDVCQDKYLDTYCYASQNATPKECKDNMANYCANFNTFPITRLINCPKKE